MRNRKNKPLIHKADLVDLETLNDANFYGDEYDANYMEQVSASQLGALRTAANAQAYRMVITNAQESEQTIVLLPGLVYESDSPANGVIRTETSTAYTSYGGTASTFTSSSSNGTIEKFLHFVRNNPSRLVGIKVASTSASQISDGALTIGTDSAFKSQIAEQQIFLSSYVDENRNQEKEVTAPVVLNLDNQKVMRLNIAADSTCTITFYIGKITNIAAEAAKN
jgi:hypothetical protein